MAQTQNKTVENDGSVSDFLNTIPDVNKREDSFKIVEVLQKHTGFKAKMWGPAIIGFGSYHYKYESGREGDAPLAGFSPRKNNITLYFSSEFENRDELLSRLGKYKLSKVCVYIKRLSDIDLEIFKKMTDASIKHVQSLYP